MAAPIKLQEGFNGSRPTVLAVVARGAPQRLLRVTATDEVVSVFESVADPLHALDGAGREKRARASSFG